MPTHAQHKPLTGRALACSLLTAWALLPLTALQASEVRVFAATSLTDVVTELGKAYQHAHPNSNIKPIFASTALLAKQIVQGAKADLFIAADTDWINYLQERNILARNSRTDLLANQLVLITPSKNPSNISFSSELTLAEQFKGKLCTGDVLSVPAGKYAKQALEYFNWWSSIKSRVVQTEDVRTALIFVERGECALGIVYSTDARLSKKVRVLDTIPSHSHAPIIYPGALTHNANAAAKHFWQYLQSPAAAQVFTQYGFQINVKNP